MDVGSSAVSRSSPSKYKATGSFASSSIHQSSGSSHHSRPPAAPNFSKISAASRVLDLVSSSLNCMYQTLACHGRAPQPWQVVGVIDHVRLITFEVSVCVVEPAFANRQLRQGIMDPK